MKKILTTAMVLGALYGTANAAPITSPIYMPEAGKFLNELKVGYTESSFDSVPSGFSDSLEKSMNIHSKGMFGVYDRLSINYGFDFDFAREIDTTDISAEFTNYYVGVTGRVLDAGSSKLDLILNIGQEELAYYNEINQVYVDLSARYGLELDMYNLGFSFGLKYINDYETYSDYLERDMAFYFKLDNEFILSENFTIGADLFYNMNGDITPGKNPLLKTKSYDEYGFNLDANFALNANNYLGLYFGMKFSDLDFQDADLVKDTTEYNFGIKLTSQF